MASFSIQVFLIAQTKKNILQDSLEISSQQAYNKLHITVFANFTASVKLHLLNAGGGPLLLILLTYKGYLSILCYFAGKKPENGRDSSP